MSVQTVPLSYANHDESGGKENAFPSPSEESKEGFTIGVCATGAAENLPYLLELLTRESFPSRFPLERIIVVASGCTERTLSQARSLARQDPRLVLIEESERRWTVDTSSCQKRAHCDRNMNKGEDHGSFFDLRVFL